MPHNLDHPSVMFLLLIWTVLVSELPIFVFSKKVCPLACPIRCAPVAPKRPMVCPSKTALKLVFHQDEQLFHDLNNEQYWKLIDSGTYDSIFNITSFYQWNCRRTIGPMAEWLTCLNGEQFESRMIRMEYVESTGEVLVDSFVAQFTDAKRNVIKAMFRGQRKWILTGWCEYQVEEFMLWDFHCAHTRYIVTDEDCNVPRCVPPNLEGTITPIPPLPPMPSPPTIPPSKQPTLFKLDRGQ